MPLQTDGVVLDVVATDPASPVEGQLWYNSAENLLKLKSSSGNVISSLSYQSANAAGDTTTGSTTDVVVGSMTLTLGAGTYLVFFTSDWSNSTSNGSQWLSCFANGVQVPGSERRYSRSTTSKRDGVALNCVATVAAGQAIDIRWRVSGGTGTLGTRALSLIKVA